ncbi:MAG: hypothetical protein H6518_05620 [Microthrixaceae bacterium]|nr:hypothetical protein [Microthrixaceae bacterium]
MLLILVVMWVAVLLPPYLRNRGGSGSASMHSFRRKLDGLERTAPGGRSTGHVSAYLPVGGRSVDAPQPLDGPLPAGSRHPLQGQGQGPRLVPAASDGVTVLRPGAATAEAAEPELDATYLLAPAPELAPAPAVAECPGPSSSVLAARAARKRRREVLYTLLAACGVTLLMGLVLGTPALLLHLLCDAALAGYVYLLITMQRAKAERDIKVAFLPHQNDEAEPSRLLEAGGGWQPGEPLLRRSAN